MIRARAPAAVGVAASVCACALAAGCARDDGPTLKLWAMGSEPELAAELFVEFERAHPGVRIDVQQLPWTSAHEKLLTAFVGDALPDIAQLGNTWLPEFAALGALAPLDAQIAASPIVRPPDYFPGVWEGNQIDGVRYGVPWYVDTRILFYRRDLLAAAGFDRVPQTWDGWRDAMRAIQRRAAPGDFAVLLPLDEFEQLLTLVLQTDEPVLRDGGRRGNFRGAAFRRALTFYLEIFAERLAPVTSQIQVPNPWNELARGYFSFFLHGPWSIGEFRRRLPAAQQALWATAAMPGPDGPGAAIAGGSSLVVFRGARHPREAWQLIEYLSRPDIQRRFNQLTGNLPPRRTSWDDPRLAADEPIHAFRDQLERVRRTPPVPEWERIVTEMRLVSERAARQVSPATTPAQLAALVDAAAIDMDARADAILEKRRWILDRQRGAP